MSVGSRPSEHLFALLVRLANARMRADELEQEMADGSQLWTRAF